MDDPILLVGGAPRVAVDAVRHLTVAATGATAVALAERLAARGRRAELLLSLDAQPGRAAERYADRAGLEAALARWLRRHPGAPLAMSAAVNDYEVASVERHDGGAVRILAPGEKLASGAHEAVIRLRSAPKLIDALPAMGHRGPLTAFKYEDAATVLASAASLRQRTGAVRVVANSLCGSLQALVDGAGTRRFAGREELLDALAQALAGD